MSRPRLRASKPHRTIAAGHGIAAQRGYTLMMVLVMIALVTGTLAVTLLSSFGTKLRSDRVTEQALAQAKEALIAYAAADPNRPGELPCPDTNNNGQIDVGVDTSGSNCAALVGRLPWVTLGLPDLRDGSGERLWYALSNNFHANGSVPLNSDTPGQLAVTGITPDSNVVAIVFAPGPAINSLAQSRTSANANTVSNYLEGTNATSTTSFVTGNASANFNDRLITIKPAEIFRVVEKRVAHELRPLINQYYSDWGRYPFAAPFMDPTDSNFRGALATGNGLLPVTNSSGFVNWNSSASSISAGLVPFSSSCTQSGQTLSCTAFVFAALGLGSPVTMTAYANNVGMAFVKPVPLGDISVPTLNLGNLAVNQYVDSNGQGVITVTGNLTVPIIFVGSITVSIAQPPQYSSWVTSAATSWITNNNWEYVIYYAAAPGLTPNGNGACTVAVSPCIATPPAPSANGCLSICDRISGTIRNNVNALIVMDGGALSGQSRPSNGLLDYLEADGNAYGNPSVADLIYENKRVTTTFNDQPFALTP